jgi:glycosyltransferase involved in cell wall biosynthesis
VSVPVVGPDFKLSVVMPVFDERQHIEEIVRRVEQVDIPKEIICVDDCSSDGTLDLLKAMAEAGRIRLFHHDENAGKGAAVRTGLQAVEGDIVIIQDGDLEYDPEDYHKLIGPILKGRTKVVYGSRFLGEHKAMYFWHHVGNKTLTFLTNVLYDTTLTDMETCYKVFTGDIARKLRLKSNRWGFDPEITARILRMGFRIYEVPISYTGREYWEGKKITWRQAFPVILTLLRYRFARL